MSTPHTVRSALADARARLEGAGIEGADLDARVLLRDILNVSDAVLLTEGSRPLSEDVAARFSENLDRRVAGEPVARILGHREFWGLDFALGPDTLVPRPDTEIVVEAALAAMRRAEKAAPNIADFGTGTGCILLALLHEMPDARGVGVDRSPGALEVARGNAERLGLAGRARFIQSDWGAGLEAGLDLLVSNPPYISSREISGLDVEVRAHDPRLALDGGADGLESYRLIVADAARLLVPGGVLVLELGVGQGPEVSGLATAAGLRVGEIRPDLAGIPRALVAIR